MPNEPQAGPRLVALLQTHRGLGVSTAAYFLGRVLVEAGLRVLIMDLSGRRSRAPILLAHRPVKNLAVWEPRAASPRELPALLSRARSETAGRVDVLLLEVDATYLEHAGGLGIGVDYALLFTEATQAGQVAADRVAQRLGDAPPPYGKLSVLFARVAATQDDALPSQTAGAGLPVVGSLQADYLLAAGDEYLARGEAPAWPHERYLNAIKRLEVYLVRRVPLRRLVPARAAGA